MDDKNIKWVTINGTPVPIKEGQTPEEAFQEFLKKNGKPATVENDYDINQIKDFPDEDEENEDGEFDSSSWEEGLYIKPVKSSYKKKIDALSPEDCKKYLEGFIDEFDEEKIKNLSDIDIKNLVMAKINLQYKSQDKEDWQEYIKKINEEYHIWKETPTTLKALETSLAAKKDYYLNLLSEPNNEGFISSINQRLNKLDKISNKINYWRKRETKLRRYEKRMQESQEFVDKFTKADNPYTQKAKDNAVWLQSNYETNEYYKNIQNTYNKIGEDTLKYVKRYTQNYSFINEPLRGKYYSGSGGTKSEFLKHVKKITEAIDKSPLKENMWMQRGTNKINLPDGDYIDYYSASSLDSLVGKTFVDQGFVSCGTHKGGGFTGKSIIMNIYCPKGTKALYVDPISQYKGESETIIQRGYMYKITKATKSGLVIYIDCDLILGSDVYKHNDDKLKELKNKYF